MAHPVTWFQIQGPDGGALAAFYKKVFNWKMTAAPGASADMKLVQPEPPGIAGGVGSSQSGAPNVAVYVETPSIAAQIEKIRKAGGTPAMDPRELPGNMGTIAGFVDPAGNWIGLWEAPKNAPPPTPDMALPKTRKKAAKKAKKKAKKAARKTAAPAKKAAKKKKAKRKA